MTMASLSDLVAIPAGDYLLGSDDFYLEERPARQVRVEAFRIERTPVTNRQFAAFVAATGYQTLAEHPPAPDQPAGSVVFVVPDHRVDLRAPPVWWRFVPGTNWKHPLGPQSDLSGLEDHPVVQVAYDDALAYARWAGRSLPDEAQWEAAARGGLDGAAYAWGEDFTVSGRQMANTWQGAFPHQNLALDGYEATSPVEAFPPNGFGISDMIGNVWEWTRTPFGPANSGSPCCGPAGDGPQVKVIKGGSHLCAPNYCQRYRPAARQGQSWDTATSHIGFRCVL